MLRAMVRQSWQMRVSEVGASRGLKEGFWGRQRMNISLRISGGRFLKRESEENVGNEGIGVEEGGRGEGAALSVLILPRSMGIIFCY